jgi:NADH-ubiquinone oxidoreductase chain 4L
MTFALLLFVIGIIGFVLNTKNIILLIISIEVMLLGISLYILLTSYTYDDIIGQLYGLYIIIIAGVESAIGLSLIIAFYKLRGNIIIEA